MAGGPRCQATARSSNRVPADPKPLYTHDHRPFRRPSSPLEECASASTSARHTSVENLTERGSARPKLYEAGGQPKHTEQDAREYTRQRLHRKLVVAGPERGASVALARGRITEGCAPSCPSSARSTAASSALANTWANSVLKTHLGSIDNGLGSGNERRDVLCERGVVGEVSTGLPDRAGPASSFSLN